MNRSTTSKAREPALGLGIYTLAEVARYTDLHPARLRSWFKGRSDGAGRGPVFQSDYRPVLGTYSVSFLDMIDALIAGQFRNLGVSMSVVRRAYDLLAADLKSPHPFCHNDLYTDGKTIIVRTAHEIDDATLNEVISKQLLFTQIKDHLHHIEYSEASRLALRWRIASGVVVDPQVCRGKPVVQGTGIATFVLSCSFGANGKNADLVADLFDVSPSAVIDAVHFETSVNRRRAA